MTERAIENRIIRNPDALGYPDASIVRNVRVSPSTGRVDLMMLPRRGSKKLVLVEAKRADSYDAAAKVVGQLIMYYAASLDIGLRGLGRIREFATMRPRAALSPRTSSLNMLVGGAASQGAAWRRLRAGRKLKPNEIDLFVALDDEPMDKLVDTLQLLRKSHSLKIRLVVAKAGRVRVRSAV